jgi:hypothetical protein
MSDSHVLAVPRQSRPRRKALALMTCPHQGPLYVLPLAVTGSNAHIVQPLRDRRSLSQRSSRVTNLFLCTALTYEPSCLPNPRCQNDDALEVAVRSLDILFRFSLASDEEIGTSLNQSVQRASGPGFQNEASEG